MTPPVTSGPAPRKPVPPVKVFIVGGGMAGLAAAWQLQKRNESLKRKHEKGRCLDQGGYAIQVFEASWRLGGKGASGRDAFGRIHEHGLHVWLGFYENAFRMMRDCYAQAKTLEMGPEANRGSTLPHASIDEAFIPEQHIGIASKNRAGRFEAWTGYLPPMEGLPGTRTKPGENPFTLAAYLARAMALTRALIVSLIAEPAREPRPGEPRPDGQQGIDEAVELNLDADPLSSPSATLERLTNSLRNAVLVASAMLLQGVTIMEVWLREFDTGQQWNSRVLDFMDALAAALRRRLSEITSIDEHVRRKTEIIDLVITVSVGLYRDRVLFNKQGLDSINGIDCREWLLNHGATRTSVDSPFITGLYDLAFCYEDGDRSRPALAAGQALRGVLRMFFTYRGSLFWRMGSGMGDAVFAPLYRVLLRGGVRFHMKHVLSEVEFCEDLKPGSADNRVVGLRFKYPVAAGGDPLFPESRDALDPTGCWPEDDPVPPDAQEAELCCGPDDFDAVVFAMGVDDFVAVCSREPQNPRARMLFKTLPEWARMRDAVKTVGTRAAQVWLNTDASTFGWAREPAILSGLDPPFETWADMTHTLAAEFAWRERMGMGSPPATDRLVHYFCGVLPEEQIRAAERDALGTPAAPGQANADKTQQQVETALNQRLQKDLYATLDDGMRAFWPQLARPSAEGLQQYLAVGPTGVAQAPFVQANFHGSQRFTLSLPGSLEKRISPLDYSVVNMTIAGEWTACGFEESCVEAAVMSGMLAAHAICGFPKLNDIVGYDHP
ncbi:FAD-dependent oxidoreductase [Variovorax sp. YR216]|uniref:FAD-dependent oxidoreductase n=1 Tax=Variovorax sp. YR216 TaxID=1882828 RepID=UPI00089D1D99|nr:NAD(P)-binding protein [Variovorax sp. YR216]SEB16056.1 NAD(P)-binding Rossmann-like domain-containing protein [Variovorax sp. YR216]